jgi:protease stability complex PrcB-like protein
MTANGVSLRLLTIVLVVGCREAAGPPGDLGALGGRVSVDPTGVLAHEYYSGLSNEALSVITDSAAWAEAWTQLYSGRQPQPPRPVVDFRTERVLLAALGQRATGGYDIQIDSVVQFKLGIVAYVRTIAPGQTCGTTTALTQPVSLVRFLPPQIAPIVFEQQAVVHECP